MASSSQAMAMSLGTDDISWKVMTATIISIVISTIAVALRLFCRYYKGASLAADDYLIIAALIVKCGGVSATGFILLNHGLGKHITQVSMPDLMEFLKVVYTGPVLYCTTVAFIKLSILALYRRLFPLRYMRILTLVIGIVVTLWAVICSFIGFFQCTPVRKAWNPTIPGHCVGLVPFYYGLQIPNILTDVIIILLPLKAIWGLQLTTKVKLGLAGTFATGILTTAFDIVRLVALIELNPLDLTYSAVDSSVWTDIEPGVAIVAACLPTLKPIFPAIKSSSSRLSSLLDSRFGSGRRLQQTDSSHSGLHQQTDQSAITVETKWDIESGNESARSDSVSTPVQPQQTHQF